jgi:hypothetical protein
MILLDKLIVARILNKYSAFRKTLLFITVITAA